MAEGARLESVYTATYRGFESLSLRQIQSNTPYDRYNVNVSFNTLIVIIGTKCSFKSSGIIAC